MANKDYYSLLGVDKGASKDEIKKAFRKKAHEHHPDKTGGDEAKFKEINEAYSVLSDDSKRAQYDQFGTGASGAGGGFDGFDFSGFGQGGQGFGGFSQGGADFDLGDIFGSVFGGRGGGRPKQKKGADISVDIEITFKESIFGTEQEFSLHRTAECDHCKGSRAEPKHSGQSTASAGEFETCKTCSGKGQVVENRRSIFGSFQSAVPCEACAATGKIPKEKCKVCKGKGILGKRDAITIIIPAGIEPGEMLRVSGKGEAVTGGATGDLYVRIHVVKDSNSSLKKDGNNLVMDHEVRLTDALLGGDAVLKTLEGDLTIAIPQGISHGEILRVRGKGVPYGPGSEKPATSASSSTRRGDLMVRIKIHMPSKISKDAKKLIEELKKQGI